MPESAEPAFHTLLDRAPALTALIDARGVLRWCNQAVRDVLGYTDADVLGRPGVEFVHPEDAYATAGRLLAPGAAAAGQPYEVRVRTRDGGWRWMEVAVVNLFGNGVGAALVQAWDVTRRREPDRYRVGLREAVTGLASREFVLDGLKRALAHSSRTSNWLAVLFLDLDNFKQVNDRHGHSVGDRVLGHVGRRLAAALRPSDLAGRYGGDEFLVLCEELHGPDEADGIAQRLLAALREPIVELDGGLTLQASVGVAVIRPHQDAMPTEADRAQVADWLVKEADAAMYQAKRSGGGICRVPDPRKSGEPSEPQQRTEADQHG